MLPRFRKAADAAIDDDGHVWHRRFQAIDPVVVERRDVAILLRRQSAEPGLAGMHDQRIGAGCHDGTRERIECRFRVLVVDADPAFDRHGYRDRCLHCGHAGTNQRRLGHQAGAETALLHPVRRTTDIEIDLVVAEVLADFCRRCEIARVGAAELKRHGMFAFIERQQATPIAANDRA